jgi:catechol 2,3-dioxygenase-like lactoylglutathione lyase family enzyme
VIQPLAGRPAASVWSAPAGTAPGSAACTWYAKQTQRGSKRSPARYLESVNPARKRSSGSSSMKGALFYVNIVSSNPQRLADFYQAIFDLEEIVEHRSPIHRGYRAGACALGFNSEDTLSLLHLESGGDTPRDRIFLTFEVADRDALERTVEQARTRNATLLKPPAETPYGSYQAVLRDPDGNPFRVHCWITRS